MAGKVKRMKLTTYLKTHRQVDVARAFGKTQSWISLLVKTYPDAKLVLVDGEIDELEYYVPKRTKRAA